MYITNEELTFAQADITKNLTLPITINGVEFYSSFTCSHFNFKYKNATGMIRPDNGYLGQQPDKKNYYLLWKLSCQFSQNLKFNPSFQPNLQSAAQAVINSWNDFIK